jgi:hypothetical protein
MVDPNKPLTKKCERFRLTLVLIIPKVIEDAGRRQANESLRASINYVIGANERSQRPCSFKYEGYK